MAISYSQVVSELVVYTYTAWGFRRCSFRPIGHARAYESRNERQDLLHVLFICHVQTITIIQTAEKGAVGIIFYKKMKHIFTLKPVLIALLVMISCTMKAEIVEYKTNDGFVYNLNSETQEASLAKYSGDTTEVVVPEFVTYEEKSYRVTSFGNQCFMDCSSLLSVVIPSSVTSLGNDCFFGCFSLTSIDIPSSVTSIGNWCFQGCNSLTSIKIPEAVTSLGNYCFAYCISLTSIKIPESVTSLGNACFSNCFALTAIDIPASVTSLGDYCFEGCSSLTSIDIPSSVTSLACFRGCSSLSSIEIPSSVTSLGNDCFSGCTSLTSIKIPESVTSLGDYCFRGCSFLTSIEIPTSVTSLGNGCFADCSSLMSIKIPASVTSLENSCFRDCSSLTSIEIPVSMTEMGWKCFDGCSSLKTVICKIENIIDDDESLFAESLFMGTPIADATLYVPERMLDTYKSTSPWNGFGTILPWTEELEVSVNVTPELGITLKTYNGNVMVSGLADSTQVSCYTVDGRMLGKASADGGTATFVAESNSVAIVKVGKKTFKIYVK